MRSKRDTLPVSFEQLGLTFDPKTRTYHWKEGAK